jgi:hypothetical protein
LGTPPPAYLRSDHRRARRRSAPRGGCNAELADFFRRAQAESRKGAEQGKRLLGARLGT